AYGNTTLGGTVTFNGTQTQNFQISVDDATTGTNSQNWTLNDVVINNTAPIADRHVQIATHPTGGFDSDRDMWIAGTLTFTSGRIHTTGATLNGGAPAEVRILNSDPTAISRTPWPPDASSFTALVADNQDRYVYGYLRRNIVAADGAYRFPVGDVPTGATAKGLQGIDVTAASDHYVRVLFEPTPVANNTLPTYCRPGDPTPSYSYFALNNGRWTIQPFGAVDATTVGAQTGPASITMYNRVVTNATTTGACPAAGTSPDDYWPGRPTDQCYVGFNANATPAVQLVNPNNCEGSNTGFTVTRTGFTGAGYNTNGSVYFATAWTQNHPLPAEDIRLTAAPAGSAIALTWTVSPEREHILGYELYRSTDGVNFSRIAQIDKQGRTTYNHRDAYVQPLTRYFYRVEQHDIFGNIRYSNTVEAMLPAPGETFSVQLQPNPVVSEGYLLVTIPAGGTLAFQLYDAAGKLVAQQAWDLTAGSHQVDLSPILAQVAAGNYNALLSWGGEVRTLRLIKADLTR
ncbi:MAG: T9SS C-terminal target domain-containing protein, partial [Bacteroidetes bacterium]